MWWLASENAALLGGEYNVPVNPKFVKDLKAVSVQTADLGSISVYDLVMKRYEQMQQGSDVFEPFTGPIKDNTGQLCRQCGWNDTEITEPDNPMGSG